MRKYDVNIDLANETKREMAKVLDTNNNHMLNKLGAFASLYEFDFSEYENPILVLKTEEPGSKQLIAFKYNKIENVCIDMIHHLINDCIVMGARPLTVQDAIICGRLEKEKLTRIITAIAHCCQLYDCVLTGGETSEQPGVLNDGDYIMTSSIVGVVDKKNIIDGSKIKKDDIVIGLESSGIHTNGYTLVRKIMEENPDILSEKIEGQSFVETILLPHRCYYNELKDLFGNDIIHGLAHITGGGIKENLNRILPDSLDAVIDLSQYRIPLIFSLLREYGDITNKEMLRTFNLGVGMVLVVSEEYKDFILEYMTKREINCYLIGRICEGKKRVVCRGEFIWD